MAVVKKSKKIQKTKRLVVPIYEQALIISSDMDDLIKYVKRQYRCDLAPEVECLRGCEGWVLSLDHTNGGMATVLYAQDLQTLVHESVHAAWRVLDHVGVGLSADNHEPLAYLVDYIYAETSKELKLK